MNHLDLFSGIGGFALAAKWAGFETILFCEKDKFCQKVLEKNFPGIGIVEDIKNFNAISLRGSIDLLTGGFPCQPFSVAGKKKGRNDDRYLWPEMFRVIRECRPTWIIAENVPGIINVELDNIINDLESENYETESFIISVSAIGAPHKRERLWIVANANGERCNDWTNTWERGLLQSNQEWNIKALQQEWEKFKPISWATFKAQNWIANADSFTSEQTDKDAKPYKTKREARLGHTRQNRPNSAESNRQEDKPPIPGVDDGLPYLVDRNKSLGNAIVPQVVYPIMKIIYDIEKDERG